MRFHAVKAMSALETIAKIEMASIFGCEQIASPTFYEVLAKDFQELQIVLDELGLKRQADQAGELGRFMSAHKRAPEVRLIQNLSLLIHHDLDAFAFEAIPRDRVEYYEAHALFGDEVEDNFPTIAYDIREAGTCYAFDRNTACVFHLMRVLEVGLTVLAKRFSVSSNHVNWETIIGHIEKAIRDIDKDQARPTDWKDQREFYSQCVSHFRVLKDAWRNYTAHARARYGSREAHEILISVRGFIQQLATRLQE